MIIPPAPIQADPKDQTEIRKALGDLTQAVNNEINAATAAATAIVESSSNSDGSWIKFSDGNMIQWGTSLVSIAINIANGSVFNSNGSPTVTMPQSFIDTSYSVTSCGDGYVWGGPIRSGKTVNSFTNYLFYAASLALADRYIHWQAIGRWRA